MITAEARARSTSTPERTEKVDVHHHHQSPRGVELDREVESPSVASNNSSSSPQHPAYHYQNQPAVGVFHSLPRTTTPGAGSSSSAMPTPSAGQNQSPTCLSSLPSSRDQSCASSDSRLLPIMSTNIPVVDRLQRLQPACSQDEDSLGSSEYTDPNTFPTAEAAGRVESLASALEEVVSRDSYELLSDSESLFASTDRLAHQHPPQREDEVPYILHRRLQNPATMLSSKSCETVIRPEGGDCRDESRGEEELLSGRQASDSARGGHFVRSRSFRSLREKAYRDCEKPALFARTRLVDIDLTDVSPIERSLFRPKSIEFVSFQNLPPPDAFSSRDDTITDLPLPPDLPCSGNSPRPMEVEFVPAHFTSAVVEPCFPVMVDVDTEGRLCAEEGEEEERMCSLMSPEEGEEGEDERDEVEEEDEEEEIVTAASSVREEDRASAISHNPETEEDEALTADDVRDVDFVYHDTLSNTSLEEQLVSESEEQIYDFVNEDDGLPDPNDRSFLDEELECGDIGDGEEGEEEGPVVPEYDYIFQAHVLSRISERSSCDSKLSLEPDEEGDVGKGHQLRGPAVQDNTMSDVSTSWKGSDDGLPAAPSPVPPAFDESTPVNESVPFDPPPPPAFESESPVMDEFPSPPSSIENFADEEFYPDRSSS